MRFASPLVPARFVAREKRFLVHAVLDGGERVVAHTNNTGSMRGLLAANARVWLSRADDPRRKLAWTLELVTAPTAGQPLVGVNTTLANRLVREALDGGLLALPGAGAEIRAEVAYPTGSSRADFLLTDGAGRRTWVEVKNVSLVEQGLALFPDAPTARGRKHLRELARVVADGDLAAMVFCVQRGDADEVRPAAHIDPDYATGLRRARDAGVGLYALQAAVATTGIRPRRCLPVVLP